jgi:hypothetical protein
MIVIERLIQKIYPDKWAELEEIDKRYDVVEGRLGFPPKKRYRCIYGAHDTDTLIIERQWDSYAAMEATYDKALVDPELQALWAEGTSIVRSTQGELYSPLP